MVNHVVLSGDVCALASRLRFAPDRLVACVRAGWGVVSCFAEPTSSSSPPPQGEQDAKDDDVHPTTTSPPVSQLDARAKTLCLYSPMCYYFLAAVDALLVYTGPTDVIDVDEMNDAGGLAAIIVALAHPYHSCVAPTHVEEATWRGCVASKTTGTDVSNLPELRDALNRWEACLAELAAPCYVHFYATLAARQRLVGQLPTSKAKLPAPTTAASGTAETSFLASSSLALSHERARAMQVSHRIRNSQKWSDVSVLAMYTARREQLQSKRAPTASKAMLAAGPCSSSFVEADEATTPNSRACTDEKAPPRLGPPASDYYSPSRRRRHTRDGLPLYVEAEDVLSVSEGYMWLLPPLLQTGDGVEEVYRSAPRMMPLLLGTLLQLATPELAEGRSCHRDDEEDQDTLLPPLSRMFSRVRSRSRASAAGKDQNVCTFIIQLGRAVRAVHGAAVDTIPSRPLSSLGVFVLHHLSLRLLTLTARATAHWRIATHAQVVGTLTRVTALRREEEALHGSASSTPPRAHSGSDDEDVEEEEEKEYGVAAVRIRRERRVEHDTDVLKPLRVCARELHVYYLYRCLCTQLCEVGVAKTPDATSPSACRNDGAPSEPASPMKTDIAAWRRRVARDAAKSRLHDKGDDTDDQWVLHVLVSLLHSGVLVWSRQWRLADTTACVAVWGAAQSHERTLGIHVGELEALVQALESDKNKSKDERDPKWTMTRLRSMSGRTVRWLVRQSQQQQSIWYKALARNVPRLASVPTLWTRLDAAAVLHLVGQHHNQQEQQHQQVSLEAGHNNPLRVGGVVYSGTPSPTRSVASPEESSSLTSPVTAVVVVGPTDSPLLRFTAGTGRSSIAERSGRASPSRSVSPSSPASPSTGSSTVRARQVGKVIVRGSANTATTTAPPPPSLVRVFSRARLPERLPASVSLSAAVWLTALACHVVCPGVQTGQCATAVAFAEWFAMALVTALRRSTAVGPCLSWPLSAGTTAVDAREVWARREVPALVLTCAVALTALLEALPGHVLRSPAADEEKSEEGRSSRAQRVGVEALAFHSSVGKSLSGLVSLFFPTHTRASWTAAEAGAFATEAGAGQKPSVRSSVSHVVSGAETDVGGERLSANSFSTVPFTDVIAFLALEAAGREVQHAYDLLRGTTPLRDAMTSCGRVTRVAGDTTQSAWESRAAVLDGLKRAQASVWLLCESVLRQPEGVPLSVETQSAMASFTQLVCRVWLLCLCEDGLMWSQPSCREARGHPFLSSPVDRLLTRILWLMMTLVDVVVHAYAAGCPAALAHELAVAVVGDVAVSTLRKHATEDACVRARLCEIIRHGLAQLGLSQSMCGHAGESTETEIEENDDAMQAAVTSCPLVLAFLAIETVRSRYDERVSDAEKEEDEEDAAPHCVQALLNTSERRGVVETVCAVIQIFSDVPYADRVVTYRAASEAEASSGRSWFPPSARSAHRQWPPWASLEGDLARGFAEGRRDGHAPAASAGEHGVESGLFIQRLPIANPIHASSIRSAAAVSPSPASPVRHGRRLSSGEAVFTLCTAPTPTGRLVGFLPSARTDIGIGRPPSSPPQQEATSAPFFVPASLFASPQSSPTRGTTTRVGEEGEAGTAAQITEEAWWGMPSACQRLWARLALDAVRRDWGQSEAGVILR